MTKEILKMLATAAAAWGMVLVFALIGTEAFSKPLQPPFGTDLNPYSPVHTAPAPAAQAFQNDTPGMQPAINTNWKSLREQRHERDKKIKDWLYQEGGERSPIDERY